MATNKLKFVELKGSLSCPVVCESERKTKSMFSAEDSQFSNVAHRRRNITPCKSGYTNFELTNFPTSACTKLVFRVSNG